MGKRKREGEREEGEKEEERGSRRAEEGWRKTDKLTLYPSFLTDGT